MREVAVNAFDRITREAASEVAFGMAVIRSAAGTVTYAIDNANTVGIDGIAENALLKKKKEGFYATFDNLPIINKGRVNVNVKGGSTDLVSGNFVIISNDFGMFEKEATATTKTMSKTIAKVLEDVEISNYTTALGTGTAGSKTLTVTATTYFASGDMVLLDAGSGVVTDSEIVIIDTIDSSTQMTAKENLVYSYSGKNAYKCVQVEVLLE